MAITKLMHMKSSKGGSPSSHLKNAIDYILRENKVARSESGIPYKAAQNCFVDHAYQDMMDTKEQYGKKDGRQGYHFAISFRPGSVTKEQLWKITQDFVEEYLPGYEVVYSLHDDQPHLHTHIVFNSVNSITGLKYHYKNGDWERIIQPMVDKLCMKYGAPTLEYHIDTYDEDGVKQEYYHYSKHFSWTKEIQTDIDACIQKSYGWEDFIIHMKEKGYTVNYENRKYVSVRKAGMKHPRRLKESTVGLGYTPEGIIERILIKNKDYRMNSVGIIYGNTSRLPGYIKQKHTFKRYADMDFAEKALVKHMLRIRNAIPEYRITPGDWYANRQLEELHRTERILLVTREYGIRDLKDIEKALEAIKEKKKQLKREGKKDDIRAEAWEDVLDAYDTITELAASYGLPAEKLKSLSEKGKSGPGLPDWLSEQMQTPEEKNQRREVWEAIRLLQESGETLDSIETFRQTVAQNKKTITGEIKELDFHRKTLLDMKKKEVKKQEEEKKKRNANPAFSLQERERNRLSGQKENKKQNKA